MYAVIKTGGKQYRVATDEVVTIEKVAGDAGARVEFTEVLMLAGTGEAKLGKCERLVCLGRATGVAMVDGDLEADRGRQRGEDEHRQQGQHEGNA